MTDRELDAQVVALARRQHGAFATRQVVDLGGTRSLIRRRVDADVWLRLDRGVLALPGNPPTWERQLKVVELGHPQAVVSGMSVAALHGLHGYRPGRPEVTVPRGCTHTTTLAEVRRRDGLSSTMVRGIRATDLPQTLIDLARLVTPPRLERAVEDALLHHGLAPETLLARANEARANRMAGAASVVPVVERLVQAEAPSMSALERRLREVLRLAGFTGARFEASPPWWPDGPERIDALLEVERVIVEGDGRAWHQRVADFENDRRRDNLAALHGYRVIRLTWTMVTRQRAATVQSLRRLRPSAA